MLSMATSALVGNPVRTLLTLLGIVIGVGCVVNMAAIGAGAQAEVADQIRSFGANVVLIYPGATKEKKWRQRRKRQPPQSDDRRRRCDRTPRQSRVCRAGRPRECPGCREEPELVHEHQRHFDEPFRHSRVESDSRAGVLG
jgi:threonine/homoserine/homoserine lactone efflux protein